MKVTYKGKFSTEEESMIQALVESDDKDNLIMAKQIIYTKVGQYEEL